MPVPPLRRERTPRKAKRNQAEDSTVRFPQQVSPQAAPSPSRPSHWPPPQSHALQAFPPHLWCWVARSCDVPDIAALLRCSPWVLSTLETRALWQYHAIAGGLAQLVGDSDEDGNWIYPFDEQVEADRIIDWRRLLQMNKQASGLPTLSVRVRDVDIRFPVRPSRGDIDGLADVLSDVSSVVHIEWACDCQTVETTGEQVAGQLRQMLRFPDHAVERSTRPVHTRARLYRLRLLQWGGRPGPVVHVAPPAGGRYLLEWVSMDTMTWSLPPAAAGDTEQGPQDAAGNSPLHAASTMIGMRLRGLSRNPVAPLARARGEPTEVWPGPCVVHQPALLRIVSPSLAEDHWIQIDLAWTLGSLYVSLERAMLDFLPELSRKHLDYRFILMDARDAAVTAAHPPTQPLKELGWVQSETVNIELDGVVAKIFREDSLMKPPSPQPSLDDLPWLRNVSNTSCSSDQSGRLERQKHSWLTDREAESGSRSICAVGRGDRFGWFRQATAPETPARCATPQSVTTMPPRQRSDPGPVSSTTGWSRQCSPELEALSESDTEGSTYGPHGVQTAPPKHPGDVQFPPGDIALEAASMDAACSGSAPRPSPDPVPLEHPTGVAAGSNMRPVDRRERVVPHYLPHILRNSLHARQFEFHPTLQDLILVGDKRGAVKVLDTENEGACCHPPVAVDSCPVLALVWLQRHPQVAVCGMASSGKISFLRYDPHVRQCDPNLRIMRGVEDFPNLTSLSANCTDDYLLATGLSRNLALYDIRTGQVSQVAAGVHEHFINIGRFCNSTPHVFATASFDHTCKIWDLRQPLTKNKCVRTHTTDGRNVMCVFSPDDRHLLCSGIDTRLVQFEVPSWRRSPDHFELREPVHQCRYRRSMYLMGSPYIVTAATEESHLRLMSVHTGKNLGVVDFRGIIRRHLSPTAMVSNMLHANASRVVASFGARMPWRWSCGPPRPQENRSNACCWASDILVRGEVKLEESSVTPAPTSVESGREFVQSIRPHPVVKNRIGVLFCFAHGEPQVKESCVAFVNVEPRSLGWED